jgi:RNA polymerase sporulation-specific sigma factor
MPDENPNELIYMIHAGDEAAEEMLYRNYSGLVSYFVRQATGDGPYSIYEEDLIAEGKAMILEAAESYREDRSSSFHTFLTIVVKRRLSNLLRHYAHPGCVCWHKLGSLDAAARGSLTLQDVAADSRYKEPAWLASYGETVEEFRRQVMASLTDLERPVYEAVMRGEKRADTCRRMGLTCHSYDGRLNRIRKRLRRILEQRGAE